MQYYRCKCGSREFYGSGMNPQPCQVCEKCGTAPGWSPDNHPEPMEHDWVAQFDQNTGKPARPYCRRCYERGPKPTEIGHSDV